MSESTEFLTQKAEIVIQMSPWGDFFVWITNRESYFSIYG